jgi:hypothetical protein
MRYFLPLVMCLLCFPGYAQGVSSSGSGRVTDPNSGTTSCQNGITGCNESGGAGTVSLRKPVAVSKRRLKRRRP